MYLKDMIGDKYCYWRDGQIFLFGTPTGSGKTSFFEEEFRKFILASGKRILYLVHRKLLEEQMKERQKKRMIDDMCREKNIVEKYLRMESGNFVISTYQRIESAISYNDLRQINYYRSFDVVIADESHYFLTDAIFNTNTLLSFRFIIDNFRNKQIIFLTATDRNFLGVLLNYINRTVQQTDLFINGMFPNFQNLRLQPNYSDIEFAWFNGIEKISEIIVGMDKNEKALIFVPSIKEGKDIKKIVRKVVSKDEIFLLSSESGQTEEGECIIRELVREQKFSCKVLISTAKMDSGVNIIDTRVKHVFILQDNEEAAIQMLGRRRRIKGDAFKVYLHTRSRNYFQSRCSRLDYHLNYADRVCRHEAVNPNDFDGFIANDFFDEDKAEVLRKIIGVWRYPNAKRRFFVNWLSCYRLQQLCEEYRAIVQDFDNFGSDAFLFRQMLWFQMDVTCLKLSEPRTYVRNVAEFVNGFINRRLEVTEFNAFRTALMPLLHEADTAMFPKRTENAKWEKINIFFEKYKLPFVICRNLKKRNEEGGRTYEIKRIQEGLIFV